MRRFLRRILLEGEGLVGGKEERGRGDREGEGRTREEASIPFLDEFLEILPCV